MFSSEFLQVCMSNVIHLGCTLICIAITFFLTAAYERVRIVEVASRLHVESNDIKELSDEQKVAYKMALKAVVDAM